MPDDPATPVAPKQAGGSPARGLRAHASSQAVLTGVIVAAAAITALYFGRDVLVPIALAMLLSFVLSPLMELLRRLWLGRVASALLAVLLAIAIIMGLGTIIGTEVASLVGRAPQYRTTIDAKITSLRAMASADLEGIRGLARKIENLGTPPPGGPPAAATESPSRQAEAASATSAALPPLSALALGQRILTPILSPIVTLGLILLVTTFILLQKHDVRDRVIRLFAAGDFSRATAALDDAARLLTHYFLAKLAINCAFGIIVGAGLVILGVPNPVVWGILGALLRFVPYFGPYLAAVLPFLLAAAVGHGWSMALWTVALFVGSELILGNVVEPMVFGRTTGLSPLAVLIAAIFWAWLWGLIGLILSTPLTLCLVVLGRHVPELAFLDILLGDRPALSPAENLYQRLLAGDPDEATGLAVRFLDARPLSQYYDEVAIAALRLATRDANRAALATDEMARIQRTADAVIQELEGQRDVPLPGAQSTEEWLTRALGTLWPGRSSPDAITIDPRTARPGAPSGSVLCVSGRGPLDDTLAAMFAQLLTRHGIEGRLVPHAAASRANIAALDPSGVRAVCILYLDITGVPAHLRFVVRRLKERLSGAPAVVGLWARQDGFFKDERAQKALGADHYVASLRQALAICRALAEQDPGNRSFVTTAPAGEAPEPSDRSITGSSA